MELEENSALEERVAKHAALADPARLRIVDLLTLGDLSPSELQAELGMTSNLLSHHLRTLEQAGMVTRGRSEADRRRTYIRLASGALEGLAPGVTHAVRRVLFVCTANAARSQLAAALWGRMSGIPAVSAGTHPAEAVAAGAIDIAWQHGLRLPDAAPQHLDQVAGADDFVVTVCDNAHEELPSLHAVHWSVPDPLRRNNSQAFAETYRDLESRIAGLAPRLKAA
ncbi:metalloregulator ArsR/SmtB family transcription factor [Pseudarthrobacter sp. NPDC092424]|uniref:metalloregulator ArsR/SmtB family transcription factor n=1 Tax=Pseudarthrobacter sp. NPDC092424 TaxID=3364415 RepID=UPI00382C8385